MTLRFAFFFLAIAGPMLSAPPARATQLPSLQERVRQEAATMTKRFAPIVARYHVSTEQAFLLATRLGTRDWAAVASRAGIRGPRQRGLWQDLNALPHPNFDQLTPYNLLSPAKDRWGVSMKEAIRGWGRYGSQIEEVAVSQGLDPAILGAYVWTESNFDAGQYNASGGMIAVGLGSVQAQDYPRLGPLRERVRRLQQDTRLNLVLTAREFKSRWNPQDMFGTVMDVWYPAWRRGGTIPHMGNAFGYMQLFSNRYFMLLSLLGN